jgi:hypothetical protein
LAFGGRNLEKLGEHQSGYPVSRPKFESDLTGMRRKSASHLTVTIRHCILCRGSLIQLAPRCWISVRSLSLVLCRSMTDAWNCLTLGHSRRSHSYKNVMLLLCLIIRHALKIKSIDSEAPSFTELK